MAVSDLVRRKGPAGHVIRGYAGVGKTTMLKVLAERFGRPIVITPTGKAALRVQEATGLSAGTVHRWMYNVGEDPRTGRLTFSPKRADELKIPPSRLVLVDEASMLSSSLWQDIWRVAKMYDLKVVLIGDGFQLPPVEAGKPGQNTEFSVMTDAFAKDHGFGISDLTEVLRQAQDSPVIRASMNLRMGGMGANALIELPKVDRDSLPDVARATFDSGGVIISHTNVTRHKVNLALHGDGGPRAGEPLLVLRNNYELDRFNGEQVTFEGWVVEPGAPECVRDRYSGSEAEVHYGIATVDGEAVVLCWQLLFGDAGGLGGAAVGYGAERWARANGHIQDGKPLPFLEANLGYCLTAHKSQGSEWPFALLLLEPSIRLGEEFGRRWAYTAVTRAKNMAAVFYGRP